FFSWLSSSPSTLDEICAHFTFARRPVDVMTTLFAAMGLVESQENRFAVTALAREHLTASSPWNLGPTFVPLSNRPLVRELLDVLSTDRPASLSTRTPIDWERAMRTPTFARSFIGSMDARGRQLAPGLAAHLDLRGRRALLDIGGGSGVYACAIAVAN